MLDLFEGPPAYVPSSEVQQSAYDLVMSHLTEKQREALEARLHGLSYSQCADLFQISIRSVRTREERALFQLRKLATDHPELLADIASCTTTQED
jgi:DNA-directed RNA polymerase specialized sigma24 family protein